MLDSNSNREEYYTLCNAQKPTINKRDANYDAVFTKCCGVNQAVYYLQVTHKWKLYMLRAIVALGLLFILMVSKC